MKSKASTRIKNAVINHLVSVYNYQWIRFDNNGDFRPNQWEYVTPEHLKMILEEENPVEGLGKKSMAELRHILAAEERRAVSNRQYEYYVLKLPVNVDPALIHRLAFLRESQHTYYFTNKESYYEVVDYLITRGLSLTIKKAKGTLDIDPVDIIRKGSRIFRAEMKGIKRKSIKVSF